MLAGVDSKGWSYWLDFPWAKWPPKAGTGKSAGSLMSFVRVRRWVRHATARRRAESEVEGMAMAEGRDLEKEG